MHVHFSVPFTLLANYIRPGRDLSSAVKNKGIERGGIQIERALSGIVNLPKSEISGILIA